MGNQCGSIFSQYQQMSSIKDGSFQRTHNRYGANVTHEDLVIAKKKRTLVPGYSNLKPGHQVNQFLKGSRNTAREANTSH